MEKMGAQEGAAAVKRLDGTSENVDIDLENVSSSWSDDNFLGLLERFHTEAMVRRGKKEDWRKIEEDVTSRENQKEVRLQSFHFVICCEC